MLCTICSFLRGSVIWVYIVFEAAHIIAHTRSAHARTYSLSPSYSLPHLKGEDATNFQKPEWADSVQPSAVAGVNLAKDITSATANASLAVSTAV